MRESRLRVSGQAVQPVLIMFPLGLFTLAVLFDLGDLLGGPALFGALAYWNLVAGLLGGVLVALAGAVDLMLAPFDAHARRAAVLQVLLQIGVLFLFAVITMLRMRSPDRVAGAGLFVVELLSLAGAVVATGHGGDLVRRRVTEVFARVQAGHRGW